MTRTSAAIVALACACIAAGCGAQDGASSATAAEPAAKEPAEAQAADTQAGTPTESAPAASETDETGFVSLFDGRSLDGWHLYRKPGEPIVGWEAVDGTIKRTAQGADLISDRDYGDFDLRFEWKISPGGNSGVFYRAGEDEEAAYWTGIEYQVLDNDRHPDGKNGPDRHAAAVYGMYPPQGAQTRPVGEWNSGRILARGAHVEHWLNGTKVAEYELWTPEWKARVADTKFKDWPGYGMSKRGHIGLQDHGDEVSYRNIRIKEL
jgi:hypothetical protein